jgi:hypothetical protein
LPFWNDIVWHKYLYFPENMKALETTKFYETHITDNLSYRVLVSFITELSTMTARIEVGMGVKMVVNESMLSMKKV